MLKTIAVSSLVIALSSMPGCESCKNAVPTGPSSGQESNGSRELANAKEALGDIFGPGEEKTVRGVELMTIRGWHANIYPWEHIPEWSTIQPVSNLWTARQTPSPPQMAEQCQQIKEYGGEAVVLEYSPNPALPWHNYWLSNGFASDCGPFYLLYEEINGTRFTPSSGTGPKNMSLEDNRKVFKEDIEFMFRNVILPNQHRYVTVNGRAVIYMWATSLMVGDFGSLLEEVKAEYPVFFIGDEGGIPNDKDGLARVKAFDGLMTYSLGGHSNYMSAIQWHRQSYAAWRQFSRRMQSETGKGLLLIPTFQAAYDDSKYPGRTTPQLYPRSLEEVEYHAELIRSGMGPVFDRVGPFVVYSENFEGGAVIESQCLPDTVDRPGRWVGCGTARLEILRKYFRY